MLSTILLTYDYITQAGYNLYQLAYTGFGLVKFNLKKQGINKIRQVI